jgi:hypothetical protein
MFLGQHCDANGSGRSVHGQIVNLTEMRIDLQDVETSDGRSPNQDWSPHTRGVPQLQAHIPGSRVIRPVPRPRMPLPSVHAKHFAEIVGEPRMSYHLMRCVLQDKGIAKHLRESLENGVDAFFAQEERVHLLANPLSFPQLLILSIDDG